MYIGNIAGQRPVLNVNAINQTINKRVHSEPGVQKSSRDVLTLSPGGKKHSMLANLMEQRQNIIDSRNELKASNAENGGSMSQIQAQLDLYEEQLKSVDEQIAKASTEQAEPEKNEAKPTAPATKESAEADTIKSLTDMAGDLNSANTVQSVKQKVDGEIGVLKAELKSQFGNRKVKLEKISELTTRSNELQENMGGFTGKINSDIRESLEASKDASNEPKKGADEEDQAEEKSAVEIMAAP